jgi:hypothetical protein
MFPSQFVLHLKLFTFSLHTNYSKFYNICSNLEITNFIPQIFKNYVKIQINCSPLFFKMYAVFYYISKCTVSNYVTEIISQSIPFQSIISHTQY